MPKFAIGFPQLLREPRALSLRIRVGLQALRDGRLDDGGVEQVLLEHPEYEIVDGVHGQFNVVRAHGSASLDVGKAVLEKRSVPALGALSRGERATTARAEGEPGQKIATLDPVPWLAVQLAVGRTDVHVVTRPQVIMRRVPQVLRDDSKMLGGDLFPVIFRTEDRAFFAPRVALLPLAPDDDPSVKIQV